MKVITIFAMFFTIVHSYPSGAPLEVCESMQPSHSGNTQQTIGSPFSLVLKSNSNCYTAGQTYEVTLSASANMSFVGFLVQARKPNNKASSYGTFDSNMDPELRALNCFGAMKSALTHNNSRDVHWPSKTFKWTAPSGTSENLEFVATVVKNFETFWVGMKTDLPFCGSPTVATTMSPMSSSIRDVTSSLPLLSLLILVSCLLVSPTRH